MKQTLPATAKDWIETLQLQPHPEGGWYRETYRSPMPIEFVSPHLTPNPSPWKGEGSQSGAPSLREFSSERTRSVATAIYFLLERDQFSALHRIKSDELWHFYAGSSLAVEGILADSTPRTWRLGLDLAAGDVPQAVVPSGVWFGAELIDKTAYALVGCTVSPGFDFADFELAERTALLAQFPQHSDLIKRLTPP